MHWPKCPIVCSAAEQRIPDDSADRESARHRGTGTNEQTGAVPEEANERGECERSLPNAQVGLPAAGNLTNEQQSMRAAPSGGQREAAGEEELRNRE